MIVVLTALELEYQAMRTELVDLRTHEHHAGTQFEVGHPAGSDCEIALALIGKGNPRSAALTERAIGEFSPDAVMFVGVAGGLYPSIELGDVVVATRVYAYHGGTSTDDGFRSRPQAWELNHRAEQIARRVARSAHGPRVHFEAIAAGEVVLDSTTSELARQIHLHFNDAVAVEMEGAGVAQAGHLNDALPVVVVRGISDHADGTKLVTDRRDWQRRAVANAAAFATALARDLSRTPDSDADRAHRTPDARPLTVHNHASGSAGTVVQAGQIHGAITFGPDSGR